MKTILVIAFSLLLCSNGVLAQNTETKADHRINAFNKTLDFENIQGFSSKSEKYKIQNPNILKIPKGNQLKSIPEKGNQKLDSVISETWNYSVNQFFVDSKEAYTYDANGNVTFDISYQWDTINNQWASYEKIEYIYDANFRVVTTKWGSYAVDFTYDANGNVTSSVAYNWNESTNHRDNISKSESTFDANGNVTLYFFYKWTGRWVNIEKCEYTYDANGHWTWFFDYLLDETTSQWVIAAKDVSIYDDNRNMTLSVYYEWDETSNQWENMNKSEYTYDVNGNIVLSIFSNWDQTTSQWVNTDKEEYTYDANGNNTLDNGYDWDITTSQWNDRYKLEFTYNAIGNITSSIYYSNEPPYGRCCGSSKATYYYSEHDITFVPEISERQISVYPNPATEFIAIDLTNISGTVIIGIYDIQGNKVMEQKLSENKQISVKNLTKGLYMYKLNNIGKLYTGKFIVE
jgi:hypothetical protein